LNTIEELGQDGTAMLRGE